MNDARVPWYETAIARADGRLLAEGRSRAASRAALERLAPQEREVVALVVSGLQRKEIAGRMGISENSVHTYVYRTTKKLDVHTAVELLALIHFAAGRDAA